MTFVPKKSSEQKSKENETREKIAELALLLEPLIQTQAKENQIKSGIEYGKGSQNSVEPIKVREKVTTLMYLSNDVTKT